MILDILITKKSYCAILIVSFTCQLKWWIYLKNKIKQHSRPLSGLIGLTPAVVFVVFHSFRADVV